MIVCYSVRGVPAEGKPTISLAPVSEPATFDVYGMQAGPLSEQRPSSIPSLSQTAGYAAVGSGSGYKSFARPPDVGRPDTPGTPNTPSTPGSASKAALVPRSAEADRKDWQTSFTDRRT